MDSKPFSMNISSSPLHFPVKFCSKGASFLRICKFSTHPRFKYMLKSSISFPAASFSRFSPLCSLAGNGSSNALPNGVGEGIREAVQQNRLLQVVLVSPQIPGNTGCIARTCAASAVGLHLIEPLGFQVDDTKLKRAGLDYWPYVIVKIHSSWAEFRQYFRQQIGEKRLLAFTKRGTNVHSEFCYKKGDWLVFGSETAGLPPEALTDCKEEPLGGGTLKIPMVETYVRCLNLSVSVGIAVYEASRQLNYEQLSLVVSEPPCESIQTSSSSSSSSSSIVTEDIFA